MGREWAVHGFICGVTFSISLLSPRASEPVGARLQLQLVSIYLCRASSRFPPCPDRRTAARREELTEHTCTQQSGRPAPAEMLLTPTRYVQILPVICAVSHLTLAFPIQTPSAHDDVRQLKLDIPHSGPIHVPLGSSISIPCFVSLSSSSSSSPSVIPRVKWTVVSGGIETQILVARSSRVKINEAYRDRVALLNYTSSPEDVSLWLGDLRHSDSGHYRCEVQQGLEDASKVVQVKVKGVVFHYRDALGRYSFSFQQAQRACEGIGAQVATPDQLLAAYFDGYEQCDAGWLADQSVRYPIQVPREGCYGDMDGQPGVRNYGTMDPDDLFDVYCYIEQIHGKVFYDPVPQQLSFDEAQSYCGAAGAQLATTAQLYSAWSEGLDRCSPGWLSDGSVRYPIVIPRERCGGPQAGVKTLYRFSNQTGFPEPSALHDVYCFKGHGETFTESPVDHLITEAENLQENVVILMEREQEIHLNQLEKQVEREAQSELESLPLLPESLTTEDPLDRNQTVTSDRAESFPTAAYASGFVKTLNESTEKRYDSQHLTEAAVSTISTTNTFDSTQSTMIPPGDYNGTDLHRNLSFTFHTSEFERSTYKPQTENQTASDTNSTESLQSTEQTIQYQEIHETSLDKSHTNYSETKNNRTDVDVEEAFWEGTTLAAGPLLQVKLEDATTEDPVQMDTTQASQDKGSPATQETPTTKLTSKAYSVWTPSDGSGDIFQEREFETEAATFTSSSQSSAAGFTAKPVGSAVASTTPQREAPDPTLSSVSRHVDKLDFEIHTTTSDLWELTISRQEGSTSSDTEEVDATQAPEQVVSGVSLPMTESPEDFNVSHSPSEFAAEQYQTLGSSYEEASGSELGTVTSIFQEGIKVASPFEKTFIVFPTPGKEENKSTSIEEEAKFSSTAVPKEEANASQSTEKIAPTFVLEVETKVTPTVILVEEAKVSPTLGLEDIKVVPTLVAEEEPKGTPTTALGEDVKITPTAALEEDTIIASTPVFEGVTKADPNVAEEANVTTILVSEEEARVDPTVVLDEETKVSPTMVLEEMKVAPVLVAEEDTNVEPTVAEESKVHLTFVPKEEAHVEPTFVPIEESKVSPTSVVEENKVVPALVVEEEANVDPTVVPVEEAKVIPTLVVEENKVVPALVVEEEANVDPTVVPVEEAKVIPTLVVGENKVDTTAAFEEDSKTASTPAAEEESKVDPEITGETSSSPILGLEEEADVDPTPVFGVVIDEESTVTPNITFEEKAKFDSTLVLEEEASFTPSVKEEAQVDPTLIYEESKSTQIPLQEKEVNVLKFENSEEITNLSGAPEEDSKVTPTFVTDELKVTPILVFEEETDVAPTLEDFTILPVNTQTSKWSLLTTTTGPQEHLDSVKISQKPPFMPVSEPSMNTKSMSSAPTISTPTYVPQRTWSPRTTRPHTFHKTTETQKVNHFMPPLDHGVVDLDISLTQPPTLHNLPKERAAVGGTGAFSDACLDDPCLNGGTCTERDGHIKCLCLPTYGGRFCQSDLERCEPGWDKFHGFCYRHFSQRQSWEVAERHCRTQGAHLVSIMTPEEQDYINSNYKEYQWTGLNDKTVEDDFRWSDGNPLLYENWYRGQPDSYFLSGEDCVVMVWHDNGRWSDVPCNYHLAYTCKKGTSSCGPPPKVRNASIFGKTRVRYETNAVVRYRCSEGFQQRLNPVVRCLSGGRWERPQILCIPEGGEIMQHLGMLSQTDSNFSAAETEFEATKETPQYWDIKF
ncbi:versican core protein-like isoform X1 [Poecilia formosa]|uniref:versican core protein-like isoform X1 n=1 Tax=Poecilia formosa TaxID=48698 RepID=UPI0007B8697A|nr:PREDICTED: versican core protein-like isoform X1 [Poecilia formosa]